MNETGQEIGAALFGAPAQREDEQPASDAEDASEAADTEDEQPEPTEADMLTSMLQGKRERNRAILESLHPSSAGD